MGSFSANFKKKIKKKVFRKSKEILPEKAVLAIQRERLEGGGPSRFSQDSYASANSFSVVSAVYNVEKYLDEYLENMLNQTIKKDQLQLVLVDDGSTDGTAAKIAEWVARYPDLIKYIRKENGGQASARNVGLDYATGDWVTFIDPDDFVSRSYFEEVDKAIVAYPDLRFITCRIVFFNETKGEYFDNHPLRSEFDSEVSLYNVDDDYMPITLSASKSFFKISGIEEVELRFDERIKPNFEDAHFLNCYLLYQKAGRVAYLREPIYYYRKREDGSSTLDSAWSSPDKFSTVLLRGKLNLLERALEERGHVPFYIQKTVLYDLQWYFKALVGHEEKTHRFIAEGLDVVFWDLLGKIFDLIDDSTIEKMPGSWLNFEMKYACLSQFKGTTPSSSTIYIERIDPTANLMLVRSSDADYSMSINGVAIEPLETKIETRTLFGKPFYSLCFSWFPIGKERDTLSFWFKEGEKEVCLSVGGKRIFHTIQCSQLVSLFEKNWGDYPQSDPETWIFLDRDTQADDNAEHLYRWVLNHHPERKCYFALRREAKDWDRLKQDGFNLIPFGTKDYERALRGCSTIISSHADGFVHSYFGDNYHKSKRFVFLQHGVTKDDLSGWLNGKPIDLMLTTARAEHNSIVSQGSQYSLTPRQVFLSGFPRHDALLRKEANRKTILIMPTWRNSLCGEKLGKGNIRALNPEFGDSVYKRAWEKLLASPVLKKISEENQMPIVFFPHANTYPYLEAGVLKVPEYIEVLGNQKGDSIQQVFADAAVAITDYSSTAFETSYLGKPCIYYQFDKEDFFSGTQAYSKGYFSYEKDGFGPVVGTQIDLEKELTDCSLRGFNPTKVFKERMDKFFEYRDGRCCERAYERIDALCKGEF